MQDLYSSVVLLNDQPTTCPLCGSRTDILFDLSHTIAGPQLHQCLNSNCEMLFITVCEDEMSSN